MALAKTGGMRMNWNHMLSLMLSVFVVALLGVGSSLAQTAPATTAAKTGKISGKVVDATTGEPLIGATVLIEGTKLGAITDLEGNYTIRNVPVGMNVLTISAVGFTAKRVTELEVKEGAFTTLDISMQSQVVETGKEVVVTATRERGGEAGAIKDRIAAPMTKDILTAATIAKTPDGSAAAALNRSVGGQSRDGEAIIRGVGDRGTVVSMNGSIIPSSDPEKQTAKIDQVSTSVVESIEIIKTFSPELPGHFSGGLVNIRTKSAPTKQTLSVGYSSGYHSETTNKNNFLTQQTGNRSVPAAWDSPFAKSIFQQGKRSTRSRDTVALMQSLFNSFDNHGEQYTKKALPNESYSVNYGNGFDIIGGRLGFNLTFSRSQEYKTTTDGVQGIWLQPSPGVLPEVNKLYNEKRSEETELTNGLANVSFNAGDRHKFSASFVRTQIYETTTRFLQGGSPSSLGLGPNDTVSQQIRTFSAQYEDRTLQSLQFQGSHKLGSDPISAIKFDWSTSFSTTDFETPDLRVFQDILNFENGPQPTYSIQPSVLGGKPDRTFRVVNEDLNSFSAGLTFPFSKSLSMRTGIAGDNKRRSRTDRVFIYDADGTLQNGTGANAYKGDLNVFYDGLNKLRYTVLSPGDTIFEFLNSITELSDPNATYYGVQDVYALYSMFDAKITSNLTAVYGVRFEQTLMFGKNGHPTTSTEYVASTLNQLDVLPAVNLKYTAFKDCNIRLSYGRTLARPTIREYVKIYSDEFGNSGRIFNGNPNLEITNIENYDLRVELLQDRDVLAVSTFYKDYTKPIELVFLDSDNGNYQYQNVPEGEVYGLEFEVRRGLGLISPVLSPFDVNANFTLVHSETKISEGEKLQRPGFTETTRPMYNQAPYTVNVGLGYTNDKLGTALNVSLNRIDKRLSFNPAGITPDVFLRARTIIDATYKQAIWKGLSLKVSGKNLTDSRDVESIEIDGNEYIFTRSGAGRTGSVGLSWSL